MKNLKIGTQLKIGFGIVLLLITILAVIVWQEINIITKQTTEIYEHPLKVRRAIGELKFDIISMDLRINDICLSKSEKEKLQMIKSVDFCKNDAFKQFDVLYERYLGPQENIDSVYSEFTKWITIYDETIRLFDHNNIDSSSIGFQQMEEGEAQVELILKKIKVIDDYAIRKADEFHSNAIKTTKSLLWQLIAFFGGVFSIVLIVIVFLMKSIRNPLEEFTKVAIRFKKGEKSVRSSYSSKNELGVLSSSFNQLADSIENEFNLKTKMADLSEELLKHDNVRKFCQILLNKLLNETNAQMGAIYFLNDEKTIFEQFEGIGLNSDCKKSFSAIHLEGEFGISLSNKKIHHLSNIPKDTVYSFSTINGTFQPREIITIPILIGDEIVAMISLATVITFHKNSLLLINATTNLINARMESILAYQKNINFSKQLEAQNSELEAQKTELSRQADELIEQNTELEMQKRQLGEANRLKTIFLSNMSHELRTPLNSVIALSGVLNRRLEGKIQEEEYSYIDVIQRNGKKLLSLINDILDLSRVEAGKEEIEISSFNVQKLLNEVVEMIEPQANIKNIKLQFEEKHEIPLVHSDYKKCNHIFQNIIANAVKFTEKGSVRIDVEIKNENVIISVIDTGIGIEEEFIPKIFEEFKQADGSNSRKYGGTGLGLSIAKKYADMLGGKINVKSTFGKGSCFEFVLPIRFSNDVSIVESINYTTESTRKNLNNGNNTFDPKSKTILLVEDSEPAIIQIKDVLELQGYNVLIAHDGSEALKQIEIKIPDAMILDLMMPEIDGFEVLKTIRNQDKTSTLPVIILTAKYVTKDELAFLKHNHIHQIIRKGDVNKNQLLDAVSGMMNTYVEEIEPEKKPTQDEITGMPKILVIEDNYDNMLTIKALLSDKCEIIEAEDGIKGIDLAKKHIPNLILMDVALPNINGIEAFKKIRTNKSTQHIPIIAVTASAMKGDQEKFFTIGFDDYISKPIDNEQFLKTILNHLNA